jgi:regulatory protein
MVITAIERQKRQTHRINIFIDGKFALGVHENVTVKLGLRKGDTIDERTLKTIQNDDDFNTAKEKALRLLSYRLRSEHELRKRLSEKNFAADVINRTISHLHELKLIDDAAFTESFVHDLILRRSAGKSLLRRELGKKGISREIIAGILNSLPADEEEDRARHTAVLLIKRYKSSRKSTDPKNQQQRITATLMRRGFDFPTIRKVIQELFSQSLPEEIDEP